jgi:hypothetical protein
LGYFQSEGLVHGGITRSNILLTKKGVAKIGTLFELSRVSLTNRVYASANPENCIRMDVKNSRTDVRALGEVMQQLMENRTENGRLGLRSLTSWSDEAVDFLTLTMTESAERLSTVSNHW